MANKIYVGNGWQNAKYPDMVNISLKLEGLNKCEVNEYGDIKLTVSKMKEQNAKTKATHTVYVNDYVPTQRTNNPSYNDSNNVDEDDLPF
jgi:hypothetical protein